MSIEKKVIKNILGNPRKRGGKNDWDGDGVRNKKDCQPRNTMRQDATKRACKYCGKVHKNAPFTDCHNPDEQLWDSLEDQYKSQGY